MKVVLAVAAVAVLVATGEGALAPPPSLEELGGWLEERGAITAAVSLLRLAALVVVAWFAAVAVVVLAARAVGAGPVALVAARGLPSSVRRSVAGAGLASVLAVAPGGAALAQQDGTATMSVLDDEEPTTTTTTPTTVVAPPPPVPAPVAADEWVVSPGESFWSIAEDVLADALGRPSTEREVAAYWRTLIEANRDRLVSASPDLVRPGQVFVLPAVSAAA